MPCFSNLWLAALPGDQAFLICVAMATQQPVDTACRPPHVMGCQKGGPQFNQSDVGVLPDQLHEERDKRFRFAAPLARHRRQRLKRHAIPDLIAPQSRRRGAQQKHLARRRSAQPPSIRFLKRTRRAIESAFPMAHPSTEDESQNVNSGNPQSIHQSMATLYCIGRNYADHAVEMGHDPDRAPPFFFKAQFTSCMHGRLMAVARQARGEAFSSSSRSNHRGWLSGYLVARRLDSTARSPSTGCVGC